ncbi:MAG TPA: DUF4433 domain-containing protein [Puia sp.]|nr:DUF4433 domain-containing protein [Puia sp.]
MTHYRNIPFILGHGLHCCNCEIQDPSYVNIGHRSLISMRGTSEVRSNPGGILNDYIPFYFHFKMPMLYHIFKGRVKEFQGTQEEIVCLVSSADKVAELDLPFLFSDRHAYLAHKTLYNEIEDLKHLQWDIIRDDTWHLQYSELRKELKQAEFLVYRHVPVEAIQGLVVHNEQIAKFVKSAVDSSGITLQVVVKPEYYYS